jgi:hypothetical protein
MKRLELVFLGIVAGIFLTIGLLWVGSSRNVRAESPRAIRLEAEAATATPTARLADENGIAGTPPPPAGSDEQPPDNLVAGAQAPSLLTTPVPGESLVYFVPTDNDASATVLYLYNTDSVAHIVALRGFSYNGVLVYSLNINVGAQSFLRLASDSIAAAPPPSWATPAPIITNFTDFTYLASLSLPKGVRAEGYVIFNPGTGVVDPRQDQGAIPLRFSTDPASLFLPVVQRGP